MLQTTDKYDRAHASKLQALQLGAVSHAALHARGVVALATGVIVPPLTRAVLGWLASGSDSSSDASSGVALGLCTVRVNATAGVSDPL
jgi:hypothetical protein